ncbi:LysR substrate-binding domain-containing protein [Mesorhizobium sp.]|uniref:LysR substrate-binding domain-containing protein n=1 Tax=Mesorhizobium sp. TaxID=1871066 RepID=UPI000FE92C18|nr:LysR substrate-binding domain-containing protein [Mesorhizobium sp.]RWB66283.1 MAG: LysR family transcriptional regulator [Mesorhizobium sp.]
MVEKSFKRSVPSLNALVALDAAVRHKSFTLAGIELGVTQTAVSRQIMALEADLGASLFHRRHRSIEPTSECMRLATALNRHFGGIADCVADFRAAAADGAITVGATSAFSQLWLLPRLVQFRRDHPNAKIRVKTTDETINLDNGDVDLAIRYGKAPFGDGSVMASHNDILYPVCSPDHAAAMGERGPHFWDGDYDLISTESDEKSWYTWQDWFTAVGVRRKILPPALAFNHFTATLYAARAGQGIALGWDLLVRTFLDDGTLVRLGDVYLLAEGQFHIVVSNRAKKTLVLDLFVDWLTAELGAVESPRIG